MKNVIILHGTLDEEEYFDPAVHSPANSHWLPWLKQQLAAQGIPVQVPEMPEPYRPRYDKWKAVFEQCNPNEDSVLVGHSSGAGFLVRWLSENKAMVGKVFLVAPWIDPQHEERESVSDFFDFEIDPDISTRTKGISIFISTDDEQSMLDTVAVLEKKIQGCTVHTFENKGHFVLGSMKTEEFPELLKEVLS